ncbi:MAG: amidohydrolase/deacetylase family metallohydrolase [Saprospiraceae bacterium]|nr:amidohydrolase/deacetylase family metallohydrolase [Saprospiraceae bacterium]
MRLIILILLVLPLGMTAQQYDLLIKGGHLIDPKNNLDAILDVAIKDGSVVRVATNIPMTMAQKTIDATDLYVSPGFVDIHSHNYYGVDPESEYSNGSNALNPDGFTFRSGVTTVVDAGGSGWRNFAHFKEQVIDRSQTRVLAFLNIVGHGMRGGAWEQDLNDMDAEITSMVAKRNKEIVGIKLAHYNGHDWTPVDRAVEAGTLANIPVMIDFGGADPPLSLETLFMEKLRPGDIYTHVFGGGGDRRQAIVDENFKLRPFIFDAQKRGIIYDVGHGGASFFYKNAVPAINQGLRPNTISTDSHGRSILSGMKDMTNVMSKLLNLGMSIQEVIAASTWDAAKVINHEELGHLSEGAEADVTLFRVRQGDFGFMDRTGGEKMSGNQKIEAEMTIRAGKIVWDLNGLAAEEYKP